MIKVQLFYYKLTRGIYYCKFLIQHTNLLCLQWCSDCSIDVGHVNLKSSKWQIWINCRFPIWRNDLHRFHFKLWITVLWKHCDLHSPDRQKPVHQNMIVLMYSPQLPVAPISQSLCKLILQKPKKSPKLSISRPTHLRKFSTNIWTLG